jgi:SAM-dependent methyltransferase
MFIEKTGWSLDQLRGKRVLDAGCGMGRFAEIAADAGAEVHAVDLSEAVFAARANLRHRPNVHIYRADIMALPFREQTFDFIYSIGVLHHTPDTKRAFLRLVPLLRRGGQVSIWVYSTRLQTMVGGRILRTLTPHLPKQTLLRLSRLAIPLYRLHRLRRIGTVSALLLPTSLDPDPEWRWLDTFDWYSPRYQWKHSYAEVEGWFREAGLVDLERGPFPVSVRGRRP